jgi:hypothetical protein
MDYTDEYRKYLRTFSLLTREAFELSIHLSNIWINKPKEPSNENFVFLSIFSKIALHANSILSILPKDEPRKLYGTENFKVIDLSSIASLTRNIIDADNILFYLFTERVDDSERKFRFLLFGLHGYLKLKEFFDFAGGPNQEQMVANLSIEIDTFRNQLEANSFFKSLEEEMAKKSPKGNRAKELFKRVEGRIENVKDAVFLTRREITKIRGIDTSLFDAIYKFLSSHVHSFLMCTSLVGSSIALDEKSFSFLLLTIRHASFYLSLAMIDATILFQETEEKLSPESRRILQRIMQGEPYVP